MFHFGFPFFLVSALLYFLPSIIAMSRKKTNLMGIFLVNFFLGWSVIGWIVALIWAVSTERVDQVAYSSQQQAWAPQAQPQPPTHPPQARPRFCPSCGSPSQPGTQYCANCGHALS
jgi:hypothetical protein